MQFCLKSLKKTFTFTQQGIVRKSVFDKDGRCERHSIAEAQQDRGSERVAEDKHPVITLRVSAGGIFRYPASSCDAEKIQPLFLVCYTSMKNVAEKYDSFQWIGLFGLFVSMKRFTDSFKSTLTDVLRSIFLFNTAVWALSVWEASIDYCIPRCNVLKLTISSVIIWFVLILT